MNDKITDPLDFENQLADLLYARVATKEITQDLDAVMSATVAQRPARQTSARTWWMAAAAVLLLGGIGLSRLNSAPDDAISTEPSGAADETVDPSISEDTTALLVWLRADATAIEVEEMAGLLVDNPVVLEIRTLSPDGNLGDFADHFDVQADGVQLTDPERRPAAFRVLTTNPGDVGDLVTDTGGLDGVENTD